MFLGKDIIGNSVITISGGRSIGKVKDIYLTNNLQAVAGIYLGSKGGLLSSRSSFVIKSEGIVTMGEDAVLVKHDEVIQQEKDFSDLEKTWLRRDELQGRTVDSPGGTKIGKVGDVIINKEGQVLGFSLSQVFISGPIAENNSVAVHTVQDVGHEDGVMTIDLEQAEQQQLSVA